MTSSRKTDYAAVLAVGLGAAVATAFFMDSLGTRMARDFDWPSIGQHNASRDFDWPGSAPVDRRGVVRDFDWPAGAHGDLKEEAWTIKPGSGRS